VKAPTRVVLVVTLPVVVLLALAAVRSVARARDFQLFGTLVAEAHPRERIVALTLDDGPVESMVDTLIDVLRAHDARATFFLIGHELAAAPEAGAKLAAAGHELGNHSDTHRRMILVTPSRVRAEVERTDSLLRVAGQRGPIWFRPPFCYKLVGGKATKTPLQLGIKVGDDWEVAKGLADAETVILNKAAALKDGQPLEVLKAETKK